MSDDQGHIYVWGRRFRKPGCRFDSPRSDSHRHDPGPSDISAPRYGQGHRMRDHVPDNMALPPCPEDSPESGALVVSSLHQTQQSEMDSSETLENDRTVPEAESRSQNIEQDARGRVRFEPTAAFDNPRRNNRPGQRRPYSPYMADRRSFQRNERLARNAPRSSPSRRSSGACDDGARNPLSKCCERGDPLCHTMLNPG